MKSTQTHRFSQIPAANVSRSSFDRSHGHKTTFDAGYLIPILVDEALPGDTHNVRLDAFGRLSTQLRPIMDNLHFETFYFAIPIRIIFDNWVKLQGEQTDPGDSTDFLTPIMTPTDPGGYQYASLADYFSIPTLVPNLPTVSLYHRAYNLVWNEWFRDQNLQDSAVVDRGDGPDNESDYPLRRRGKRHDYFTSGLPFPQKGDAVQLGLGGVADVLPHSTNPFPQLDSRNSEFLGLMSSQGGNTNLQTTIGALTTQDVKWDYTGMEVDLGTAVSVTVNEFREAFQIQRVLERDARAGTRYPESILAHFNVTHPDQNWRTEYLGGSYGSVNVSPIVNVSDFGSVLGDLGGLATMQTSGSGFTKSFTEHSIILGLCSVRADLTYQNGLHRKFSRRTRFDYFLPALQHLGEQAILNQEIYAQDDVVANADVFAYQERFAEYRYEPSKITGKFRSTDPQSLDIWHLAQDFASLPVLNDEFIEEDPPIDRIVAVTSEPQFILDMYFNVRSARPMATYGVPGQVDHF